MIYEQYKTLKNASNLERIIRLFDMISTHPSSRQLCYMNEHGYDRYALKSDEFNHLVLTAQRLKSGHITIKMCGCHALGYRKYLNFAMFETLPAFMELLKYF